MSEKISIYKPFEFVRFLHRSNRKEPKLYQPKCQYHHDGSIHTVLEEVLGLLLKYSLVSSSENCFICVPGAGGGSLFRQRLTITQVTFLKNVIGMSGLINCKSGFTTFIEITQSLKYYIRFFFQWIDLTEDWVHHQ